MNAMAAEPTRPLIRYLGGKWKQAKWIASHFPEHSIYCEPFGGAASVLLRKDPSPVEIYNDLSGEIVNLWKQVRDNGEVLSQAIALTPYARAEYEQACVPSSDPLEQARRSIVKSLQGFSSISFSRKKSGFRCEATRERFPCIDWDNYVPGLRLIIERFRRVMIESLPATDLMIKHDSPDTLFYVDPPYVLETRNKRDTSYKHELDDDGQRELAETLRQLKGQVVLSGYPCDLYDRDLYPDWRRFDFRAYNQQRRQVTDSIWVSPGTPLPQSTLF